MKGKLNVAGCETNKLTVEPRREIRPKTESPVTETPNGIFIISVSNQMIVLLVRVRIKPNLRSLTSSFVEI